MYEKEIAAIEKAAKFSEDDVLSLWLLRMIGDKKAPRAAQTKCSSRDALGYYDNKLFRLCDRRLIGQRLRFKDGTHFIAVVDWHNYRRVGWRNTSLNTHLCGLLPRDHRFVIGSTSDLKPPSIAKLRDMLWSGGSHSVYQLCNLFGINRNRVTPGSDKRVPYGNDTRSGYCSTSADGIIYRYSKEYRDEQREKRRLDRLIEQHRDKVYKHMWPFNAAVEATRREVVLAQGTNREPTVDEVFAHVGYTPQPNDLFKLLTVKDDGTNWANSGCWPAVGEWTEAKTVYPCRSGWHLTRAQHLMRWQSWGPDLFLAEGRGDSAEDQDKVVFAEARLVRHLGKIDWAKLKEKINYDPTREAHVAAAKAKHEVAQGEYDMATAGYAGMAEYYQSPEQEYIRRLTDQSIPLNK